MKELKWRATESRWKKSESSWWESVFCTGAMKVGEFAISPYTTHIQTFLITHTPLQCETQTLCKKKDGDLCKGFWRKAGTDCCHPAWFLTMWVCVCTSGRITSVYRLRLANHSSGITAEPCRQSNWPLVPVIINQQATALVSPSAHKDLGHTILMWL